MAQIQREHEEKALAAAIGLQRASKKEERRQMTAKKRSLRQQRLLRNAAAPSRASGQRYMEDWMFHREETEETQDNLNRIFREGKLTS